MEDDLDEISMNIKIRISWFPVSLMTKISNSFMCLSHALMQTLVPKILYFSLFMLPNLNSFWDRLGLTIFAISIQTYDKEPFFYFFDVVNSLVWFQDPSKVDSSCS